MKTWRIIAPDREDWIDGDLYLHVNSNPVTIAPGSRQRALPCVICETPAGSQQCYLIALIAGVLCAGDNSHLNGLGLFCHVRCLPKRQTALRNAVARALLGAAH